MFEGYAALLRILKFVHYSQYFYKQLKNVIRYYDILVSK